MKAEQTGKSGFKMEDSEEVAGIGLPKMTFATLVLSLSTSVLVHLGVATEEGGSAPEQNLPMARQTIDILEVLKEKTAGNLTEEEGRLLEGVLHDLRMRFVEANKG